MNKFFILFIAALLYCGVGFTAIFRINSNLVTDASQKIYKTIQEANNAVLVLAGDTLMIEGSPIVYADASLNKRLVLIGTGYLLTQNPQTQANPAQSVVSQLTLQTGSEGSVIMGLTFSTNFSSNAPQIYVNNVIVMRCYMPNPISFLASVTNVQILQNFFVGNAISVAYSSVTITQVSLKNNYIGNGLDVTSSQSTQRVFSAIDNNIFLGSVNATTTTFRSNIIVTNSATVTVASAAIENNLVSNGQLPATSGNQTYVAANLFAGAAGNSPDGQYKVKAGSPYIGAGYGGTQPGVFGGSNPYILSGIPPIPTIYEFTADGFANKNTGLPINIKVKANQ